MAASRDISSWSSRPPGTASNPPRPHRLWNWPCSGAAGNCTSMALAPRPSFKFASRSRGQTSRTAAGLGWCPRSPEPTRTRASQIAKSSPGRVQSRPKHGSANQPDHQRGRESGRAPGLAEKPGRNLWVDRQVERPDVAANEEDRVRAANARVTRIIDDRVGDASRGERFDSSCRTDAEFVEVAKLDRLGRSRLRARGRLTGLLAVVAERALERPAVIRPSVDNAERARDDAVAAAIADVGLHEHAAELGPDDGAGRAGFETPGMLAVLADVRREVPRRQAVALALDELHMAP